mmetsp:Transcript_11104/g.34052  ORF Transcript_11104/g.34052 Transcript_11104/m.34052 type:complete len:85 (+) Transcript_11104:1826-2080(+)
MINNILRLAVKHFSEPESYYKTVLLKEVDKAIIHHVVPNMHWICTSHIRLGSTSEQTLCNAVQLLSSFGEYSYNGRTTWHSTVS